MFERCCNAYLVFYERVEQEKVEAKEDHHVELFNKIHEQNQAFKHLKVFSDQDFIKFMLDYIKLCTFPDVLYF